MWATSKSLAPLWKWKMKHILEDRYSYHWWSNQSIAIRPELGKWWEFTGNMENSRDPDWWLALVYVWLIPGRCLELLSVSAAKGQHGEHQILGKWVDCKRATREGSKGALGFLYFSFIHGSLAPVLREQNLCPIGNCGSQTSCPWLDGCLERSTSSEGWWRWWWKRWRRTSP